MELVEIYHLPWGRTAPILSGACFPEVLLA